jgi:type IV pilus assembly protein PilE
MLSMNTQRGFTLLELMITLVVIGILTAIALPNYAKYVIRGNIPDATGNLANKRVQMEQFYQDNRTYLGAPACVNDTVSSQNFTFSCTVQTATAYTLQATGIGRMAGFTYTVDQNNARTSAFATPAPSTWVPATPNNCWVTKEGGVC